MVPQIHILMKRRAAPLQPPEIIYFCKFRPKRVWNYAHLACKIQKFLRQGGAAPLQPHTYTFWQKRDWNWAFVVPPKHILLWKEGLPPLQPRDIIFFCKLRPKRAWNYEYLARKIQNFLRLNFDRKETEIVHLWFPKIHILLRKEGLPPLRPPEIIYFCKFRPKRDWNYA